MTETDASADYSLRILWSLARWIEDTKGPDVLATIARDAGVDASDFDGSTRWVSHAQLEKILSSARALMPDDETFKQAFAHRFKEGYGAFRHMIWALSQQQMCETAAKMSERVFTHVARFEILTSKRNEFAFRYRSTRPESRLVCLSRHIPWTIGPTIWDLPPIDLVERACIGLGDEYCEYHLRWFERSRFLPVALGGLIGLVCGAAAQFAHMSPIAVGLLPLVGVALGYANEQRSTNKVNTLFAKDVTRVMRELGETEAETRSEIYALHLRQREWIRLVEQQVTERTATLEHVVEGLNDLQFDRVSSIRGFSHDLRNPLFVVRGNAQFLRERFPDGEEAEVITDIEQASVQIEQMLTRLMEVASKDPGLVKLSPERVHAAPLVETFRRRMKALVHGRDIKATAFSTRDAPDHLIIDPLVFDRVIDNLLTNAAKYTERGSILLEISGTSLPSGDGTVGPPWLTLKLSDTGAGIAASDLPQIFKPRAISETQDPRSYGVGLSSVVMLMAQIGGRLEVMSKPGVGTTFWAHFPPIQPETVRPTDGKDTLERMIMRVVTIRQSPAS